MDFMIFQKFTTRNNDFSLENAKQAKKQFQHLFISDDVSFIFKMEHLGTLSFYRELR